MIEINLIPDVKQELINAQRVRSSVISLAILLGIISIGVVVLLALYVFVGQFARTVDVDGRIKSQSEKLASIKDLNKTLTVQNQLIKLDSMHADKSIDSRVFDVLGTIIPAAPNNVSINKVSLDNATSTITIDAQADSGFPALEVFKKTIAATKVEYLKDGKTESVKLASSIVDSDRSFGQDVTGKKILRFTLSFVYPEELFSRGSLNAKPIAPDRTNVTDSFVGVPFAERAADVKEPGN